MEFIEAWDDYLSHYIESVASTQEISFLRASCNHKTGGTEEDGLRQLDGEYWIRNNGDTLEKVQCLKQIAVIAELETCYCLIPIQTETGVKYVRPSDRLLISQATPAECNTHFGLKLKTLEGPWIQLNPTAQVIPAPVLHRILDHNMTGRYDKDLSSGGLYSTEELQAW